VKVTLALIATGRRSGEPREVELYAFPDGERLIVVGSRGGSVRDPVWADNLRAEPRATILRDGKAHAVRASEAEGAERDRLWQLVCEDYPMYEHFRRKTKRLIPIFVLDMVGEGEPKQP